MNKIINFIYLSIAPLCGAFLVVVALLLQLNGLTFFNIKGIKDVIGSVISVGSIVIGFYSAFYGILVSIQKSKFMELLSKSKYRKAMPKLLIMALITAFVSVFLSIVLQILINYANHFILGMFFYYVWLLITAMFIVYAFQTSVLAIYLIFDGDERIKKRIDSD